jgi:hypothetical protein
MATDFTIAAELAERLRDYSVREKPLRDEAADLIERMADRINHLTNVNDGLRETLDSQRTGLAELKAMLAEKSA